MDKDIISNVPPYIKSEGRNFKRFSKNADVYLKFSGHVVKGKLINVSMSGLLGLFHVDDNLPEVSARVTVGLDMDGKGNVFEIDGTVARMRKGQSPAGPEFVELALDFSDQPPENREVISNFVTSLIRKDKSYSYTAPIF